MCCTMLHQICIGACARYGARVCTLSELTELHFTHRHAVACKKPGIAACMHAYHLGTLAKVPMKYPDLHHAPASVSAFLRAGGCCWQFRFMAGSITASLFFGFGFTLKALKSCRHEIVGIVTEVGAEVTGWEAGARAGIGCFVRACRDCKQCHKSVDQYCRKMVRALPHIFLLLQHHTRWLHMQKPINHNIT